MSSAALKIYDNRAAFEGIRLVGWQRVSRQRPCPVCSRRDFCEVSQDGETVHCMRVASDRPMLYRQGGWLHGLKARLTATAADLRPVAAQQVEAKTLVPLIEKVELAPVIIRHQAIKWLLAQLNLSEEHQNYLAGEGFEPQYALSLGYRTLPRSGRDRLTKGLVEEIGPEMARGLAFLYEKPGKGGSYYFQFAAARADMLLIPIRNTEGYYLGLKGRWMTKNEDTGKEERHYRILSAGSSGGASLGTPLHVSRRIKKQSTKPGTQDVAAQDFSVSSAISQPSLKVVVTEGEKKADYIAWRTGLICVGVQGTGNWRALGGAEHLVAVLARLGAQRVEIAFDADLETNPRVARDLYAMGCQLQGAGFEVGVRRWSLEMAKGYDDLLRLGLGHLARLEPFSAGVNREELSQNWVKKFVQIEPETMLVRRARQKPKLLYTVEEARSGHAELFRQAFGEHLFSLGRERQSLVVTSNPGTGKTHAALAEALEAVKNFPQGRILYLADNKEVYRQWLEPDALLHKAYQDGLVAVREGRQRSEGRFQCRRLDECEKAGRQRHAPTWDVCASCPFSSKANWKTYLKTNGLAADTAMEWNCREEGYWGGVEIARKARLVVAPKASFFNNSQELAEYDIIIADEGIVEHLLERVDVTRETLTKWRESIQREVGYEKKGEEWQHNAVPFLQLFEILERLLAVQTEKLCMESGSSDAKTSQRTNLWAALPILSEVVGSSGEDVVSLLEECRQVEVGPTGRYSWERPLTGLDGQLSFSLHFAHELVEVLWQEIVEPETDTRLWISHQDKEVNLAVFCPRQYLLQILQGEEGTKYKNDLGKSPTVVLLDATPSPLLNRILSSNYHQVEFEVTQHVEVMQLTNSLYTKAELIARQGKALEEVSRVLSQECSRYNSAAVFCHKLFNPAAGEGPLKLRMDAANTEITWGHFDRDNKALNRLSEVNCIAIVGHYCHPLDILKAQVQAFRRGTNVRNEEQKTYSVLNSRYSAPGLQNSSFILRTYGWQDAQGKGLARRCRAEADPEVQAAIEHSERAAIIQAIGRGRPTLRSADKPLKVILITAIPLGELLPVERLAEAKELLGESSLTLAQAEALARGRALRLSQQGMRQSEVARRIQQAFSDIGKETREQDGGYLRAKEVAEAAGVSLWQLQVLGLNKALQIGNKANLGPELYIKLYKQYRYGLSLVFEKRELVRGNHKSIWTRERVCSVKHKVIQAGKSRN